MVKRAGTNVNPFQPVMWLMTGGPFRRLQDPLYLSAALVYAGVALSVNTLGLGILFMPFLAVLHIGVVVREECCLAARFGGGRRA